MFNVFQSPVIPSLSPSRAGHASSSRDQQLSYCSESRFPEEEGKWVRFGRNFFAAECCLTATPRLTSRSGASKMVGPKAAAAGQTAATVGQEANASRGVADLDEGTSHPTSTFTRATAIGGKPTLGQGSVMIDFASALAVNPEQDLRPSRRAAPPKSCRWA